MNCKQARERGLCLMNREGDCPDYPCVYLQWAAINRAAMAHQAAAAETASRKKAKG